MFTIWFLVLGGFVLVIVSIDTYMELTQKDHGAKKFAGLGLALLLVVMFLIIPLVSELPLPSSITKGYAIATLIAPWAIGLWFIQLCLIEDRRQAGKRNEPSTTTPEATDQA